MLPIVAIKSVLRQQDGCVQPGDLFCTSTKLAIELVSIHVADLAPELWTCIREKHMCKLRVASSTFWQSSNNCSPQPRILPARQGVRRLATMPLIALVVHPRGC